MKFLLLFLVSLVCAYDIGQILQKFPKCALDCVTAGAKEVGCGILDLTCECSKFEQLTKIVTPCLVHAGCKLEEVTQSAAVVVQLCEAEYAKLHNTSDPHIGTVNDDPKKAVATTLNRGALLGMATMAMGMLFML